MELLLRIGSYPERVVEALTIMVVEARGSMLSERATDLLTKAFLNAWAGRPKEPLSAGVFARVVKGVSNGNVMASREVYQQLARIPDGGQLTALADALMGRTRVPSLDLHHVGCNAVLFGNGFEGYVKCLELEALGIVGESSLLSADKQKEIARRVTDWLSTDERRVGELPKIGAMRAVGRLGQAAVACQAVEKLASFAPYLYVSRQQDDGMLGACGIRELSVAIARQRQAELQRAQAKARAWVRSLGKLARYGKKAEVLGALAPLVTLILAPTAGHEYGFHQHAPTPDELTRALSLKLVMKALSAAWTLVRMASTASMPAFIFPAPCVARPLSKLSHARR